MTTTPEAKEELTPKDVSAYTRVEYWDERFSKEERYEWLVTFDQVKEELLAVLPAPDTEPSVLIVGCGNSSLSEDLWHAGFTKIVNIDYSEICITRMQEKYKDCKGMEWRCMDMRHLSFDASTKFDVVLDKAGMDAVTADEGSVWNPDAEVVKAVDDACQSISSVLKAGGRYVQISFHQPHFRLRYLRGEHAGMHPVAWRSVSYTTIEKTKSCFPYFMFVCDL